MAPRDRRISAEVTELEVTTNWDYLVMKHDTSGDCLGPRCLVYAVNRTIVCVVGSNLFVFDSQQHLPDQITHPDRFAIGTAAMANPNPDVSDSSPA